ncbi:hypothetical protein PPYR_09552 [Photinus pyralis]|uniref:Carboxypeptidase n=1 Tax=Photinus pyralis TaxID=7054 RepID=A0A5N4AMK2_PHOPY|nr:venom serine carboxypeptidase-like [Photinus pyralis]KAB0798559.1 hypothetical protein PPYR_09552 [Photinus pyralis]
MTPILSVLLIIAYSTIVSCDEDPLVLTPLLNSGKHEEAQTKSKVNLAALPNISSHSGYFKVSDTHNSHMFFWFFKSERNVTTDPIILCLQGGPGFTALIWPFLESGPLKVNSEIKLEKMPNSWTSFASVLYIDNPVGVGFSFGDRYPNNIDAVTVELYDAVRQFFQLFPTLKTNEFYIVGESYAGKYASRLGKKILEINAADSNKTINLVGIAFGNALVDPQRQFKYSEYLFHTGLISKAAKAKIKVLEDKLETGDSATVFEESGKIYDEFTKESGYQHIYSIKDQLGDHVLGMIKMDMFVDNEDFKKTLHVGTNEFLLYNGDIAGALTDLLVPIPKDVEYLLGKIRVLVYDGQSDVSVPLVGTINYLRQLNFDGSSDYKNGDREMWKLNNVLVGYITRAKKLTHVIVRNSGHMVPLDQHDVAYNMIMKFLSKTL